MKSRKISVGRTCYKIVNRLFYPIFILFFILSSKYAEGQSFTLSADSVCTGNIIVESPQANMNIEPACGTVSVFFFTDESVMAQESYFVLTRPDGSKERFTGHFVYYFDSEAPTTVDIKIVAIRDDNGCRDSLERTLVIPEPLSDPLIEPTEGQVNAIVIFNDSIASLQAQNNFMANGNQGNRIVGWVWDFLGDGSQTTIGQQVQFQYNSSGTFNGFLTRRYEVKQDGNIAFCEEVLSFQVEILDSNVTSNFAENRILDFSIFPNPSNQIFTVESELKNYMIRVTNVNGVKVYEASGLNDQQSIIIENWAEGIYFVTLLDSDRKIAGVRKVVGMQ